MLIPRHNVKMTRSPIKRTNTHEHLAAGTSIQQPPPTSRCHLHATPTTNIPQPPPASSCHQHSAVATNIQQLPPTFSSCHQLSAAATSFQPLTLPPACNSYHQHLAAATNIQSLPPASNCHLHVAIYAICNIFGRLIKLNSTQNNYANYAIVFTHSQEPCWLSCSCGYLHWLVYMKCSTRIFLWAFNACSFVSGGRMVMFYAALRNMKSDSREETT